MQKKQKTAFTKKDTDYRMNTKLFSAAIAAATTLLPLAAQAQITPASNTFTDNAANSAYASGYNAGQGGSTPGFGAFNVATTGPSAGTFVFSAVDSEGGKGTPAPSSIDSSSKSFGIFANSDPTSSTTVTRTFAAPTQASGLNVAGDTFSLDFVTGYNDGNATVGTATPTNPGDGSGHAGVALTTAAGTVGSFLYQSNNQYLFNGSVVQGQNFTTGALHLLYTLNSPTMYSLQVSGPFQFNGTGTFSTPITGFQVQQANSGGGDGTHNAFFNNLAFTAAPAAVPEASSSIGFGLLLALGGLAVVARKRSAKA